MTVDISSEAVERYQPDRFDDLAYWFWSIHPREVPDPEGMPKGYPGGARAWMYAKAIRGVAETARTEAQQEAQATLRAQAERIKELDAELARFREDRSFVIGWNDGFEHGVQEAGGFYPVQEFLAELAGIDTGEDSQ